MFLRQVFKKSSAENNLYYLIGDLNINCLEYFKNEKVSTFCSLLLEYGVIALINKPNQVGKESATICHHQKYFRRVFKKGIVKSDCSDHFIYLFSFQLVPRNCRKLKKRIFNENNLASFKYQITNINWDNLNSTQCSAIRLYETFLNTFNEIYDFNVLLTEIEIKP